MIALSKSTAISAVMIVAATLLSGSVAAAELDLPRDGWASWEIDAMPAAKKSCCYDYRGGRTQAQACDLDGRHYSFSGDDSQSASTTARVYALMSRGQLHRVRALDSSCPVRSKSAIADLGKIDTDLSASWLSERVQPRNDLSEALLAAVALHAGEVAKRTLYGSAQSPTDSATRKNAIFWLGQVRGIEAAGFLRTQMREDDSAEIREHAAFSLSQSDAPNRAEALIEQGRNDRSTKVRSQAWFWLAQTEDAGAEAAINAAMADEADGKVQEQQVFALSQLPDERSAKALIGLIGNPQQPKRVRKQALFWLGQSDTPQAYQYLDALLAGD